MMVTRISNDRKAATAAFIALLAIYSATLAPTVTFWDSGEFLAAIHSLGIPHPPGTPLYVLTANVWAHILSPVLGFARSVNLFSAVCAAAGCALFANLFARWTRDRYSSFAAAICAGATSSLWMSATETEVYAPAFFVAALLIWIANEFLETRGERYLLLLVYVAGLGWALHLTALLALPAAIVLAAPAIRMIARERRMVVLVLQTLSVAVAGASVIVFMYLRARHDPSINQGNPSSLAALVDVITRKQYEPAGLWPRQAPLYLQFGNVFEWADWQFALGLNPSQPPSVLRTPVSFLYALFGVWGCREHRRLHRVSWRAQGTLFLTAIVGVVVYLNLKAGPSYGIAFLRADALHEARERDYFFLLAWVSWGLWAGFGAMSAGRKLFADRVRGTPLGLVFAAAPLAMNWVAVDRTVQPASAAALQFASELMRLAPARAVLLAHGDNDTYPVWYVRQVARIRPDVVMITVPMLPTRWYRDEIARRHALLDQATVHEWKGTAATLRVICERAAAQARSVVGPFDRLRRTLPTTCSGIKK